MENSKLSRNKWLVLCNATFRLFSNFLVTNRREERSCLKKVSPSFSYVPLAFLTRLSSSALYFSGKSRCEDSFGRSLPFRPLGQNDIPEAENPELHSILQQSSAAAANLRTSILEPELLTKAQDIEVVLGDSTVLPCRVAHLGNSKSLLNLSEGLYLIYNNFSSVHLSTKHGYP